MQMKKIVSTLAILALMGCTALPPRPELPITTAEQFYLKKQPSSGARLYVTMGLYQRPSGTMNRGYGSGELMINGTKIEVVSHNPEFSVIDVSPGQYHITWIPISDLDRSKTYPEPRVLTVGDGDVYYLALDFIVGSNLGTAFGAIGAFAGANFRTEVRTDLTGNSIDGKKAVAYLDLRNKKF